ncbi:hypothetical protein SEA_PHRAPPUCCINO_53 [Mycobacterium phage Phrappuccino]|uniref:Capsid maturation protease n=1 Tax=Mycobacterium phage Phrappuccino TaxID=2591223 RepID=A0A514DDP7_9CAUD|nr:hypothetical protein KHQ87_gp053 [Mycobacterium phage Phrappuccino]QDH91728.1 hypothetical protein SEA_PHRAPPUCCINO_53 [Mycobacterium phage Phrappuccino]QIQ63171.1 hypothetical protein SEA_SETTECANDELA_53 [Mycobacterium phage Settecandela]
MTNALRRVVTGSTRRVADSDISQLVAKYRKTGTVAKKWSPEPGFVYAQVRAISARVNQNFDAWPSGELQKAAHTFVGKPIFVNHKNFDVKRARGKVVAARYIESGDDKYIETIMEVDAQRYPKLAKEIVDGGLDSVSMGVEAGFTVCSACNNRATDEHEFCDHVRHHKGQKIWVTNHKTGKREQKLVYEDCFKLGFFELSWVFDPADETALTSRVMVANNGRVAYGETEVPEDIDTLRDDENDSLDDYEFVEPVDLTTPENPFQHYLESPPELSGPDFDMTKRLDRQQEEQGLDGDRLVEDIGDVEGDPDSVDAPPRRKTMGRTRTDARRHAADEHDALEELEEIVHEDLDGDGESGEDEDHREEVLDDDADETPEEDSDDDSDDEGDDAPEWVEKREAQRRSAKTRRRAGKKGQTKGSAMTATAARRRQADTSGHTDGGPYGENNQGEQEEVFISQTPAAEALVAPTGDESKINNTESNLVASIKAKGASLQRDLDAYQRLQAAKRASSRPYRQTADFVASLPVGERVAAAQRFAAVFAAENPKFSPRKFFAHAGINAEMIRSAQRRTADAVEQADKVNPELSGTDDQSLRGDDFDDVSLDDVETQPKDASKKVFAAFETWVRTQTGKTAAQHNPNWLRRQAARWATNQGLDVAVLYPTLGNVLRQARKGEATTGAPMNRRANDTSLDVAAPDGRVDVEAPVANETDADAQASQYDLKDFAHNAGDDLADPELSSDSQIWAPGEGDKTAAKADGVAAVRYAEAVINAGLAPATDRWKLAKQAETMRRPVVVDRTRLLEAVATVNASKTSKTAAAVSRGTALPRGLTNTPRVAATNPRLAAADPSDDSALFF